MIQSGQAEAASSALMVGHEPHLIIVGGGLTGSLVALLLAKERPDLDVLLLEASNRLGGNIGPFEDDFEDEVVSGFLDPLVVCRWSRGIIANSGRTGAVQGNFAYAAAEQLHAEILGTLSPRSYRLGCTVSRIASDGVWLNSGEFIAGEHVIDTRQAPGTDRADAVFVRSTTYKCRVPHGLVVPILIDATLPSAANAVLQYFPLSFDTVDVRVLTDREVTLSTEIEDRMGEMLSTGSAWLPSHVSATEGSGLLPSPVYQAIAFARSVFRRSGIGESSAVKHPKARGFPVLHDV